MKEDPIKSFKRAFSEFLKEEHLEHTFKQKQLIANWEELMGKTISSRTTKLFFKGKTLYIQLSSAPLKQEMQNSRERMLTLIREQMGAHEIDDIRIL